MAKVRASFVCAILASLWACGSPEQAAIDQFFRAAQANDSTTLAYMADVSSPVEVESWKVVEVSSRSTEPFTLPELLERFDTAKKERDTAQQERQKFAKDNQDALEQIIPKLRDNPEYVFKGKLAEIQAKWTEFLKVREEKEHAFQELKQAVNRETSVASKSVMRQVDVGTLRGSIAVTQMLLNLKSKDHGELPFKATLRKYDLSAPGSDRPEPARWVIVDFEGTTEEAKAAAAEKGKKIKPAAEPAAEAASSKAEREPAATASRQAAASRESAYQPRELRGLARIQILNPETKVERDGVSSTIRVRNSSRDWITGFTVAEYWYDKQGEVVGTAAKTHPKRFMPGEVLEFVLRQKKNPNFFQNQYKFSHANGEVNAAVVASFPKPSTE
jgi:hypothetical protein